ncbi:helix-turn-helix domain-containing protein [Actinopolyspora mortivallis]|uniref:IS630 family transposase n=1 Tax=Actinopolyspora mortivallis TaxID=33906 RepID=A0A2T0GY51_ACTMO|nr:helix-turn-helix domain-containing protein [Actinopolyspora mortivallis]PRW64036.1 IS630 family transposase [Actinopolyspora mortivallis]
MNTTSFGSRKPLSVSQRERNELVRWIGLPSTPQAVVLRCRIVLACARGSSDAAVARELGVSAQSVGKWRRRFLEGGVAALRDRPRSGAPRSLSSGQVRSVLEAALTEPPPNGLRWSKRSLAARTGVSPSSVVRILRRAGVTPPRTEEEHRRTPTGWSALYVAPPESVMAVAVDERSDPENGAGRVFVPVEDCGERGLRSELATRLSRRDVPERGGELAAFLRDLARQVSGPYDVHLVCHGHGTHKIEAIRRWQEQHPGRHLHFTPTKELWIRLVERYFLPPHGGEQGSPLGMLAEAVRSCSRGPLTWFRPR